jgi:hypothetical protein
LPESTEVRLKLQDYLARTGMAPSDFARRINYARETVYQFLNGHYSRISSNDGLIRTAIRDFIAAHPIAAPAISSGKLYETENARLLRQYFYEALDHGRAYYLYGAPGTQKTHVLQHLIAELNRSEIAKNGEGRRAYYVYVRQGLPLAGPDEAGGAELRGNRNGHGRPDSPKSAFRSRQAQGAAGL